MTQEYLDRFIIIPEKNYTQIRLIPPYVQHNYHYQNNEKIKCTKLSGQNCLLCQAYNESFKNGQRGDFGFKPIQRWHYNVIVRGKEELGPQIIAVGRSVQDIILKAILNPKEVELTSLQRWTNWLMSWWYWSIRWIYKPSFKSQPTILDLNEGCDFILRKEMKTLGELEIPDYSQSHFVEEPSAAGTPEQLNSWKWHKLD